jgi:hypothetical protein
LSLDIQGGRTRSIASYEEEYGLVESDIEGLDADELAVFLELLGEWGHEDLGALTKQVYSKEVVSMEQFLEDDYYLGIIGETLYPKLKEDLIELFNGDYHEAILSGSIGWGKNTFSGVAICRMVYEMSCLRDPQEMFGLESGSEIAFCCISVNEQLAKHAVFGSIKTKIMTSRYFMQEFPYKPTLSELRFPNNIWVAASSSSMSSALSLNTFGGIMDEVNFMPETPPRVQRIRHGSKRRDRVSHAETLYNMVIKRMKSRFLRKGKVPGILMLISSKSHTDAFTEKRIAASINDPGVFVREYALWDVKRHIYSGVTFPVLAGNERVRSDVVESDKELNRIKTAIEVDPDYEGCKLVDVPEDFKKDFEGDLDSALQDLAGIATVSLSPFIARRNTIYDAIDETREHPMDVLEWDPSTKPNIDWRQLVKVHTLKDNQGNVSTYTGPIINPDAARHVHVDTSLSVDATGICICHVSDWVTVHRRDRVGEAYEEEAPEVYVDFMLRVVPPVGGDIVLADVRGLLYEFMDHGFHFNMLSTDQYQSAEMRQYFEEQRGVETKLQSVDRTIDPYLNLRSMLYENRISYYHYPPFLKEIQRLIMTIERRKQKVDHLPTESKDICDAMAGACFTIVEVGDTAPLPMRFGISESQSGDDPDAWVREGMPHEGKKPVVRVDREEDWIIPTMG